MSFDHAVWPMTTVGAEFEVKLGKMLDAATNSGDLKPYVGNRAVQWGTINRAAVGTVPLSKSDQARFRLRAGDLLVCEGGEVGRGAIWRNEIRECYYQKALHRLRPKRGYDSRIMLAFLEYWAQVGAFTDFVTRTSIAHLPREKFILMPLPEVPWQEQQLIAAALHDMSELVISLERLIAKKQAIKQGIMQQLLTGTTRLPGFVGPWDVVPLGAVSEVKTGPFGSALHESDYVPHGTPIITVEHLAERGVEGAGAPMVSDADRRRLRAYALRAGDIVFSRVGSIDRNARVTEAEEGWLFSGRLLRVRVKPLVVDPRFMSAQFHSMRFTDAVRAVAVGQTMPSLNTRILKGIQIQLPPLSEQQAIGEVVDSIDRELDAVERQAKIARNLKQGMMQELLTGRSRLNVAEAAA